MLPTDPDHRGDASKLSTPQEFNISVTPNTKQSYINYDYTRLKNSKSISNRVKLYYQNFMPSNPHQANSVKISQNNLSREKILNSKQEQYIQKSINQFNIDYSIVQNMSQEKSKN